MRLSLAKNVAFDGLNEKIMFGLLKAVSNMYGKPSASNNVFLIRHFVSTKITEGPIVTDHTHSSDRSKGHAEDGFHWRCGSCNYSDDDSKEDSEEEEEAIRLPIPNGLLEAKKEVKETKKEEKPVAANKGC
nr:retrovirus-related Pol polyprotein from transposon TNT 1-94 [Tanacetum cinerariifolium]